MEQTIKIIEVIIVVLLSIVLAVSIFRVKNAHVYQNAKVMYCVVFELVMFLALIVLQIRLMEANSQLMLLNEKIQICTLVLVVLGAFSRATEIYIAQIYRKALIRKLKELQESEILDD